MIAIIAGVITTAQFAYSQNLITNGDFETGNFNGWTIIQAQALVVAHRAWLSEISCV